MIEKYLNPGDKVEIQFEQRSAQPGNKIELKKRIYISKINQILNEDKIEIMMPIEQSKLVLLPRSVVGNLVVYTKNGLFQCKIKVGDRYKSKNTYIQVLELISGIKKYQRREFYRYSCTVPLYCRLLTDEEKENLVWDHTMKGNACQVLDIGGGGIRFMADKIYQKEDLILCFLELEGKKGIQEIQAVGKVLACNQVKNSGRFYEIRIQFEKISNDMREKIVQFIFDDERRKRKI